ncbi:hypothetical protein RYX36_023831 [Vicia faba]
MGTDSHLFFLLHTYAIQSPPHLTYPSEPQSISHKSSCFNSSSNLDSDSPGAEKREKVRVRVEDPPADEDWLRYYPPPSLVRVGEVRFSKEKRYAHGKLVDFFCCKSMLMYYNEGLGEAYDRDISFANALETFGGGHNNPINVDFKGPVMTKFPIALREIRLSL